MTREGYETYLLYLALQRHFSTTYDFFKYNGKVNASKEAYSKRNDMWSFEKLSKIIPEDDRVDFFVAHFKDTPKEWIRNMSKTGLDKYRAIIKNLPTKFKEDLEYIKMVGPAKMIAVERQDIPLIHDKVLSNDIAKETVIILNNIFPFLDKHEKEVELGWLWPDYLMSVKKYAPFIEKKLNADYNIYTDIARQVLL